MTGRIKMQEWGEEEYTHTGLAQQGLITEARVVDWHVAPAQHAHLVGLQNLCVRVCVYAMLRGWAANQNREWHRTSAG